MNKSYSPNIYISIILPFLCLIPLLGISQDVGVYSGPGARWGHVLIYDIRNNNLLLFGGTNKKGGEFLNDTWIWENNEWKKMDVKGPSPRGFCAVTFHKGRNTILLHGGRGNDRMSYSDIWEWNGLSWNQLEINSSLKADHHQMVYLNDQNAILAFGGWNGKDVMGDTWVWSDKWEQLKIPSPPKRASFSMAYNEKTKSVILYGGLWINGQYADLWEWSNNNWKALCEPYDNSSLDHHVIIYDKNLKQIIGFGGKNYRYVFQNNTFKLENNEIIKLDAEGPSARHSFGFTYDTRENYGYLYGGKKYANEQQLPLDDFWRWDGEKWKILPLTKR